VILAAAALGATGCGDSSGSASTTPIVVKDRAEMSAKGNALCDKALKDVTIKPDSADDPELKAFADKVRKADVQLRRLRVPKELKLRYGPVQKALAALPADALAVTKFDPETKAGSRGKAQGQLRYALQLLKNLSNIGYLDSCAIPYTAQTS
jgi:hypothetical protein